MKVVDKKKKDRNRNTFERMNEIQKFNDFQVYNKDHTMC